MTATRPRNASQTRADILSAARCRFAAQGYERTTLAQEKANKQPDAGVIYSWRIYSEGLAPQNYSGSIRHSDENRWLPPAPWTVVAGRASCQILVGGRRDSGPPGSMASRRPRYDS
jgi:hypothetical protein